MDARLETVAEMIRADVHVDVGSDHAKLLRALLRRSRIRRGIAIENKLQPFENSRRALGRFAAEVRFGDGLAVLGVQEANSLSICGMGAGSMLKILDAHPDRLPGHVVLQPNRQADLVRTWALRAGFHLVEERVVAGHWPYEVMSFESVAATESATSALDPAYVGLDLDAALAFGPMILRRREPTLLKRLREERTYWHRFTSLSIAARKRLSLIDQVLG